MKRRITNGKTIPGTLFYRLKQFSRNEMKPGLSCHLKSGRYVTPWGFASHTIRVSTPTKSVKLSAHLELRDISDDTHIANRGRYVTRGQHPYDFNPKRYLRHGLISSGYHPSKTSQKPLRLAFLKTQKKRRLL